VCTNLNYIYQFQSSSSSSNFLVPVTAREETGVVLEEARGGVGVPTGFGVSKESGVKTLAWMATCWSSSSSNSERFDGDEEGALEIREL
jgi:hypothetical protein